MTKQEVLQKITDYEIPVKRLNEIDNRLHQYIDEVLSHPDDHNKYEILGVFRFLDFLQKYEFRDKEAKKFFTFYECLKFPSNKGMKSFKLTPMQVFVFSHIYGFYKEDGNRLTRDALLFIPRKWSKALDINTPIPTPNGYVPMRDIQIGDYVYDENGQPTKVTDATEIMYGHKVYEMTFSDGDKIIADADHNWYVRHYGVMKTLTTQQILDCNYRSMKKNGYYDYKMFVPQCNGIDNEDIELPFDPYTFGVWLGDGHTQSPSISLCGDDCDEILSYIAESGIRPKLIRKERGNSYKCSFTNEPNDPSEFRRFLTKYKLTEGKYIPEIFFKGSMKQKLALIQGIMDTDGTVGKKKGNVSITQKSDRLADDFCRLLTETGYKWKRNKVKGTIKDINFCGYYNSIRFHPSKQKPCFRLARKKQYLNDSDINDWKSIVDIREVESVPVKCISVDNPKHLYVCGTKGTVTHNTTSVSACAIYDLLFGENDAQAYVASNSFSQSQIGFEIVKNSLKALDPKLSHFRLNRDIIYNKMPDKTSLIRCLASSADRLDGLNASTVICDEFAQADSAALRNVLTSSMGIRKNPLVITITTASSKLDTPFTQMLSNYKKVLEGDFENDSIFASIFQADDDDDIGDPKTWRKVQPHLGITVNEDFYRAEYQKALMSAEDMLEFKCKLLNIFTLPTNQQWVNPKVIERNTQHFDFSLLKSRPNAMVSVDLSVKDDFSCVCYTLYDSINKRFIFKNNYYIPKQTIETHPNRELYQRLVDEGHLIICGDDVIDYKMIANDIIGNGKYLNILQIGYDAYRSKEFINIIKASGIKCAVPYSQTYSNFTSPIESFELAVHQDRLKFDDNPLNLYCINNVAIDVDKMENKKPIKKTNNDKIDGAICMLMCLGMFNNYKR